MDPSELRSMMAESDLQVSIMQGKGNYLQRLFRIQDKPYFGSIRFKDEDGEENIYIGITHVEDKLNYYVHDWRSPICSMFYDYETGPASYKAPSGIIKGEITKKRQYIIENAELKHIFDNDLNISDSLLQEVLAEESSDKMKNIVNTIKEEQNKVKRNTENKNVSDLEKIENADNNIDLSNLLTKDKKIVAFIGTSKNGTSFIVNNLAQLLSEQGIKTAILDLTKNKNAYYVYTNNQEELRQTAFASIPNLVNGIAKGIEINRNLSVWATLEP